MNWKKTLAAILLASLSFGIGVYHRTHKIVIPDPIPTPGPNPIAIAKDEKEELEDKIEIKGRINILLLGEDNVEESKRSDTVAFVAIDIDNGNMRVLSLPRDTRVAIPGHGNQKLNHAYAYGQQDLLKATVERFLGTNIHYYVKIDYDNFPKLVDIVEGVDIFVGKPMKYRDRRGGLDINIAQGKQRMDGETALKYVRFRKDALGDIGRVQRQQQFLKALLHRMYEPENLLKFSSLSKEISNTLITDMPPSLTFQLCLFVKKLEKEPDKIFFMMLPGTPAIIDNLSYWVADSSKVRPFLNANTEELVAMDRQARLANRRTISDISSAADFSVDSADGVKPVASEDVSNMANSTRNLSSPQDIMFIVKNIPEAVAILNGTGKSGVGQSVAAHLQKMGIDVIYVGNAKHFDYKWSNVIYPDAAGDSSRKTAQLLSQLCEISSTLTRADRLASYPSLVVGHDYEALLKRLENSYAKIQ